MVTDERMYKVEKNIEENDDSNYCCRQISTFSSIEKNKNKIIETYLHIDYGLQMIIEDNYLLNVHFH